MKTCPKCNAPTPTGMLCDACDVHNLFAPDPMMRGVMAYGAPPVPGALWQGPTTFAPFPVSLGADPVQWAAVQMAMALLTLLSEMHQSKPSGRAAFFRWVARHDATFGGSLEREP